MVSTSAPTGTDYSCPVGWVQSGSVCSLTTSEAAQVSYSCPTGGTLSGSSCTFVDTVPADVNSTCEAGWTFDGSMCFRITSVAATITYGCPTGYNMVGSVCEKMETQDASLVYSCRSGETLSGTTCQGTEQSDPDVSYSCTEGTLQGDKCLLTALPTPTGFVCPSGYSLTPDGYFCQRTATVDAGKNYSCPTNLMVDGDQCLSFAQPVTDPSTQCVIDSEVCSDSSPQTRVIDGVSITQACWGWTRSYTCNDVTSGNSDCSDYESDPSCSFLRQSCLDDPPSADGHCSLAEKVFSCPVPGEDGPGDTQYLCGGDLFCVNGACEEVEREASDELKDALVALGAMDQAQKEFDEDSLTLFEGEKKQCHKKVFGLVNCCSGKGIPLLTPFLCNAEERLLDTLDDRGLCHSLGSYCSNKVLGVCTTKKTAYCCYQSKLTRIIQEQGRPQLGKSWGKPKEATCEGFTVDEFSRLDLSLMDFSEIYSEFLEAAKLPDEIELAGEIQARIRDYYQDGSN